MGVKGLREGGERGDRASCSHISVKHQSLFSLFFFFSLRFFNNLYNGEGEQGWPLGLSSISDLVSHRGRSWLLVLILAPSVFPLGLLVFLPPQKPTFKIPIQVGNIGQEEPPCGKATDKFPLNSQWRLHILCSLTTPVSELGA